MKHILFERITIVIQTWTFGKHFFLKWNKMNLSFKQNNSVLLLSVKFNFQIKIVIFLRHQSTMAAMTAS